MIIYYSVEDELSGAVAERLIREFCPHCTGTVRLGKAHPGSGYIKNNLRRFYDLSHKSPVLILTDLDRVACPPALRSSWLKDATISEPLPSNMLFCVVQTEIESWLLADSNGIAGLLQVSPAKLSRNIEKGVLDAKEYLVQLARASSSAQIRRELAPAPKSQALIGLSYNYRLSTFVGELWNPSEAANYSLSLRRAVNKLSSLKPVVLDS